MPDRAPAGTPPAPRGAFVLISHSATGHVEELYVLSFSPAARRGPVFEYLISNVR